MILQYILHSDPVNVFLLCELGCCDLSCIALHILANWVFLWVIELAAETSMPTLLNYSRVSWTQTESLEHLMHFCDWIGGTSISTECFFRVDKLKLAISQTSILLGWHLCKDKGLISSQEVRSTFTEKEKGSSHRRNLFSHSKTFCQH